MKQNKVNHCKQYGLQWNDFKVPYGAIYGRYQGVNFVLYKTFQNLMHRVFLSGLNVSVVTGTKLHVITSLSQTIMLANLGNSRQSSTMKFSI